MLFMITQVHAPESCPIEAGGSGSVVFEGVNLATIEDGGSICLYNPKAKGIKLQAMYGAYPQHIIWYVVEADSVEAVQEFLKPGFSRCTSTVTPISSGSIVKK
ncbi:MAG: hypothetical protein ABSF74_10470 [Dehalococcoidia bacterium]|jgi:hypothetical protein